MILRETKHAFTYFCGGWRPDAVGRTCGQGSRLRGRGPARYLMVEERTDMDAFHTLLAEEEAGRRALIARLA
jgi:hypothetical protein